MEQVVLLFVNCRELKIGSKIVAERPWAFEVDTQNDKIPIYYMFVIGSLPLPGTGLLRRENWKALHGAVVWNFERKHYVSDVLKYIPATMLFTCGLKKIVRSVNTLPVFGHVVLQKPVVCLYGQWEHDPCVLYGRPGIRAEKNETVFGGLLSHRGICP